MGLPPVPRVGNPRGGAPLDLGGKFPPLAAAPPIDGFLAGAPLPGAYIKGGGQQELSLGRLPPPLLHLSLSQKLGEALPRPATSTTTPSCCWISINLSFPLAGSRRRRRRFSVRVLNTEVPSVRRSVIGDLDHDEYDSINPVHLNASA